MHCCIATLVLIVTLALSVNAARILSIFAIQGPTQYAFVEPLLKQLAQRGHSVTSITNFPQKEPIENFRDIVITENKYLLREFGNFTINNIGVNHYDVLGEIISKGLEMCEYIHQNKLVRDLRQTESFDIILLDIFFSESFFGFAQHFSTPIVGILTVGASIVVDELVGTTTPISYVPNITMKGLYTHHMKLYERCLNMLIFVLQWLQYYYEYLPKQRELYERYFPNATKTFQETQTNFSLVLVNDHFTITTPKPYVPNMIEVAGMHIPTDPEPMPLHIDQILNAAKQGVIYVSTDPSLPVHIIQMMLNQLEKLPQIVLWNTKFTHFQSLRVPPNVQFHSDVSHHSILSHKHMYLLISHGSYLNLIDSIHYGVPILGIPNIHGGQEEFFDFINKTGNGLSLRLSQINARSLSTALHDLLATDRYRMEAKLKSQQFRDQQNTPLDRAVYWIEYVLRHKGAPHLRNLGQNLTSWQFYNLDVLAFICSIIIIVICVAYVILKICLKLLRKCDFRKYKIQ